MEVSQLRHLKDVEAELARLKRMADALWSGRRLRTFNVNDDFNRESLRIEIDTNLPSPRVVRALDERVERPLPAPGQRPGVHQRRAEAVGPAARRGVAAHPAGQADSERLHRRLQPDLSYQGPGPLRLHPPARRPAHDRRLALPLQPSTTSSRTRRTLTRRLRHGIINHLHFPVTRKNEDASESLWRGQVRRPLKLKAESNSGVGGAALE